MRPPPVQECDAWELWLLICRSRFLVHHENVRLMAAHAGFVLQEWLRLQLRHLIAVAAFARADRRPAREILGRGLAVAHGALDAVGAMRAGFPLVPHRLMAGGTGIPGRNQPVHDMCGFLLLCNGRFRSHRQKEKRKHGETDKTRADLIHGKIPLSRMSECRTAEGRRSVMPITSHRQSRPARTQSGRELSHSTAQAIVY